MKPLHADDCIRGCRQWPERERAARLGFVRRNGPGCVCDMYVPVFFSCSRIESNQSSNMISRCDDVSRPTGIVSFHRLVGGVCPGCSWRHQYMHILDYGGGVMLSMQVCVGPATVAVERTSGGDVLSGIRIGGCACGGVRKCLLCVWQRKQAALALEIDPQALRFELKQQHVMAEYAGDATERL